MVRSHTYNCYDAPVCKVVCSHICMHTLVLTHTHTHTHTHTLHVYNTDDHFMIIANQMSLLPKTLAARPTCTCLESGLARLVLYTKTSEIELKGSSSTACTDPILPTPQRPYTLNVLCENTEKQ